MRRFGLAAALVGLLAVAAAGDDAVTLKFPRPKAGDRVKVTKTEKTKATVTFGVGGKSQAKDEVTTKSIAYIDEVVTAGEGDAKPTAVKRTYTKYEVTKGGKDEPAPPLDTTILIEKKGGKYTFTANGKPVDAALAKNLSGEFDKAGGVNPDLFLPNKPVKPGDTWKVDGSKIASILGGEANAVLDTDKSEFNGKLVKTYQKGGKQFGVIDLNGDLVVKSLGEKVPVKIKPGSKIGFRATVDACVDGTDPTMKLDGTLAVKMEGEGGGITLAITADGVITETHETAK